MRLTKKGLTHRDLKPANILVTGQGIKLLDFGLAKQNSALNGGDSTLTEALTREGHIVGTLQYMSPEQFQGREADNRSDLFAFGCVFYELLSGRRAFDGSSAASVIAATLEREPSPIDVGPPLDRVIRACLAKDPEQRFQTALDLKRALDWASDHQPAVKRRFASVWVARRGARVGFSRRLGCVAAVQGFSWRTRSPVATGAVRWRSVLRLRSFP